MTKKFNPQKAWLLVGVLSALLSSVTLTGCGGGDDDEDGGSGVVQPRERDDD